MKHCNRILSALLALTLALSLCACGAKPSADAPAAPETGSAASQSPAKDEPAETAAEPEKTPEKSSEKEEAPGPEQTLGDLKDSGYTLFVEEGTFGENAKLTVAPSKEDVSDPDRYEVIGEPLEISCDEYDGTFFGTDVVLTVPLPKDDTELSRFVFVTTDEATGDIVYLYPDTFDSKAGTMSVALPHFSSWWGGKLTEEEQIDAFLDKYCTKQAVANGESKRAASELEPYVRQKAEALGMTKQATEDLIQSTINYLGGQAGGKYKGAVETGTKAITSIVRGVYDEDEEAARNGLEDAVNGAMTHCWEDLKFSKRIGIIMGSKPLGEAGGEAVKNARGLGAMAGYLASGTAEGNKLAMEELGNMLQNVHPAAEFTTKGAAFLAASANMAFTNWKSNQVEELYKVYRDGKEQGFFGNEVIARNRDSFLTYLNTSSGFTVAKGVKRFYNLDNIAEVCEQYGWDFKTYAEMPERYREIFEKRAEDSLLEYFEMRIEQEAEAEKLKEIERQNIETMLLDYGALKEGRFMNFFHEESADDYDISRRLERLINVRGFLTQYVDEKALNQSIKDGGFNWGDIVNWWVGYADEYPKDEAIDKLIADLQQYELLNPDFELAEVPELSDLLGTLGGDIAVSQINISDEAFQYFKEEVAEGVDLGEFGHADLGEDMQNITQAQCDEEMNAMIADGSFGLVGQISIASDDAASGACTITFTFYDQDEDEYEEQPVVVPAAYAGGTFTLQDPHSGTLKATVEDGVCSVTGSVRIAMEEEGMTVFYASASVSVSKDL